MTLYTASLMDLAKPVEKKGKKQKEKVEEPKSEEPKSEVSEKRLAALAKAQETRKRKREEAAAAKASEEEAIKSKEAEIQAKQEEIARKKEALKEKRRLKREEKKQEQTPPASEASSSAASDEPKEPVAKKPKKVRAPRDESIPPAWFQKYVEGVKLEEAKQAQSKVSKKAVEQEARTAANEQWKDGLTRDRVQNEVDGHMSRMYGMIFHNRRMK